MFLTGGIGITPVRSIVEHATQQQKPHHIFVFYSNRLRRRMAFFDDFQVWSDANENLNFMPTLTQESPRDWNFEIGKIDQQMLSRHVPDLQAPVYYAVGPPTLLAAMRGVLEDIGLDEVQIKSEDFAGY